jgi:hypothetical protein
LSDNRTKPICEDASETALYRGSGRLFKPRPGPTSLSRVKNSGGALRSSWSISRRTVFSETFKIFAVSAIV